MERLTNLAKVTHPESSRAGIQMQIVWVQSPYSSKSVDSIASTSWHFFLGWSYEPWKFSPFRQMRRENPKLFWPCRLHEYLSNCAWQMAPLGPLSSLVFPEKAWDVVNCTVHMTVDENLLISGHMVCISDWATSWGWQQRCQSKQYLLDSLLETNCFQWHGN